ncbi:hypothetical protein V2W45_1335546 [Cenococcum geophilum]
MIVVEIGDMLKEKKAEDILDIEPKLVALAESRVVGNNRVLDTIELDAKINIPTKDNIKLTIFSNAAVDNVAVEDGKVVNIAKADLKLDMLTSNPNNIVLNKDRDAIVDKAVSVMEIKLSSIDVGITAF